MEGGVCTVLDNTFNSTPPCAKSDLPGTCAASQGLTSTSRVPYGSRRACFTHIACAVGCCNNS